MRLGSLGIVLHLWHPSWVLTFNTSDRWWFSPCPRTTTGYPLATLQVARGLLLPPKSECPSSEKMRLKLRAERRIDGAVGHNARADWYERFVPKRCRSRYRGIATALHSAPVGADRRECFALRDQHRKKIKIMIKIKIKKRDVSDRHRCGEMPELTEAVGEARVRLRM
jgi:hypothetical protein